MVEVKSENASGRRRESVVRTRSTVESSQYWLKRSNIAKGKKQKTKKREKFGLMYFDELKLLEL